MLSAVLGTKQFRLAVWEEEQCISGWVNRRAQEEARANYKPRQEPEDEPEPAVTILGHQLALAAEFRAGRCGRPGQVGHWVGSRTMLMCRKYDVIALLVGVAKAAVKEKVQRVVVATLRVRRCSSAMLFTHLQNLLTIAPAQNIPSMFTSKLLPFVTSLQSRKWSDEEVVEDLEYLKTELASRLEGLTTYDEYVSELESGHLVWSPSHESEEFWKENGLRIGQENGGKAVKCV